jgi:LCP family protein required for cell wall assembly
MSEWPEGWFRGTPGAGKEPTDSSGDATTDLPIQRPGARPAGSGTPRATPPRVTPPRAAPGGPTPGGAQARNAWPDQPPPDSSGRGRGRGAAPGPAAGWPASGGPAAAGGYGGPPPPGGPGGPGGYGPGPGRLRTGRARAWLRPRRIFGVLAVLVALLLVSGVVLYFNLNGKLDRKNVLIDYAARPAQGSGTNWLIAGSDSRQGLTRKEERRLSTGVAVSGHRSDTILVLHVPSSGKPVLISLPRDSYVQIPGFGGNKLNAAYAFGGPQLLARTVQNATGLRIDHYMEIGFGGFVSVVNAVGGVRMCIKVPLHDQASGLNIRRGCQTLDGAKALGYVRDRHNFAGQDLQRIQDQRLLLKALLSKLTSAGVLLNPFAVIPAADGAASTLTVDTGTNLIQLAEVAFALRGPQTTTVPIATANFQTSAGDAVLWDHARAQTLFRDLNNGTPVPKSLITGSSQGG